MPPGRRQIEVEMILMRRVGRRRQYGIERPASAARHIAQEGRRRLRPEPVLLDADKPAIGQLEGADIDGPSQRMLRDSPGSGDGAAGISAHMVNAPHMLPKMGLRGRLQDLPFELVQGKRNGAANADRPVQVGGGADHCDRRIDRASAPAANRLGVTIDDLACVKRRKTGPPGRINQRRLPGRPAAGASASGKEKRDYAQDERDGCQGR